MVTMCRSPTARASCWRKFASIYPRPPIICCSAVPLWHKADMDDCQPRMRSNPY